MNVIAFIIVGLIAGFLAGKIVDGRGFGAVGDIVIGIVGAFIGGFLFDSMGVNSYGMLGAIAMATVGAVVLLLISNLFTGRRRSLKNI